MAGEFKLRWKPPGPIAERFYYDRNRAAGIQGPVGSGKTTTVFQKVIRLGVEQRHSLQHRTEDDRPVRRFKACVVHHTYRQLWRAVMPTWWKIVPQNIGNWSGGRDGPATHQINIDLGDRSQLRLLMDFVAIGDNAAEDVLRGYEPTVFCLMEADLQSFDVWDYLPSRWGRYPEKDDGGPTWHGALLDFNAPIIGTWLHQLITENKPDEFSYYRQPSGLSPQAENIHNLVDTYYQDQRAMMTERKFKRMCLNEFGQKADGKPVFENFDDATHVSPVDLEPIENRPLVLGFDAGGTPAMVVFQRTAKGQWRGLDELAVDAGSTMWPSRFSAEVNRLLRERYPQWTADRIEAWADPSAFYGGDEEDETWVQTVMRKTKLQIRPAPGNNALSMRLDAVSKR